MLIHREALELATIANTDDNSRFALSCLHVNERGVVTVTDGCVALRMSAAVDEPSLFDQLAEQNTDELDEPAMIPADVAAAFLAGMKKRKAKPGEATPHVVVAQQDNRLTLRSSDGSATRTFVIESDLSSAQFPKVARLFAQHKPGTRLSLSVDILLSVLRILKACKVTGLTLDVPADFDGALPIALSAFSLAGPIAGVIMPMRGGDVVDFSGQSWAGSEPDRETPARDPNTAELFGADGVKMSVKVDGAFVPATPQNILKAFQLGKADQAPGETPADEPKKGRKKPKADPVADSTCEHGRDITEPCEQCDGAVERA